MATDGYLHQMYDRRDEWPRVTRFSYRVHTLEKGRDDIWTVRNPYGEPVHLCPVVDVVYGSAEDLQEELNGLVGRKVPK